MRSRLELRFRADDDGTGELLATVTHGPFAGAGSAWFNRDKLRRFGTTLQRSSPIPSGVALEVSGGYPDEPHLALRVTHVDARGTVVMRVQLATPNATFPRFDERCVVSVPLAIEQRALRDFGEALVEIVDGKRESAEIVGDAA